MYGFNCTQVTNMCKLLEAGIMSKSLKMNEDAAYVGFNIIGNENL